MLLPPPPLLAQALDPERLERVCGTDPTTACRRVLEWTDSDAWANVADFLLGRPLRVLVIVVIAWILNRLMRRAINRGIQHARDPHAMGRLARAGLTGGRAVALPGSPAALRAGQRMEAIGNVVRSGGTATIWGIAGFTILGELGISLGPLLASAGIAGIAIGFGAQNLVKDFLSGVFMLVEDQFGVGDIIDVGDAMGVVEGLSLRTTRLRDLEGTLWHVPNGEIRRVGNKSQEWARALMDVGVAYSTDLKRAAEVIKGVADEMQAEPEWSPIVMEEPEIWGIQELGDSGIAVRLVVKTKPGEQWRVKRELNGRLKARFDEVGIEIPFPQRTVWLRTDATGTATPVIGTTSPEEPSVA